VKPQSACGVFEPGEKATGKKTAGGQVTSEREKGGVTRLTKVPWAVPAEDMPKNRGRAVSTLRSSHAVSRTRCQRAERRESGEKGSRETSSGRVLSPTFPREGPGGKNGGKKGGGLRKIRLKVEA